jgi:uncharacterized membrane protein YbhN (UPF0104 family)
MPSFRSALLFLSLATVFAVAVHYLVGWREVFQAWTHVSAPLAGGAVLLMFASYASRTARLMHYLQRVVRVKFWPALRVTLVHNLFNHVLPFRTGEVSFPILLKRAFGVDVGRSVVTLMWFRLLDASIVFGLGGALLGLTRLPHVKWVAVLMIAALSPAVLYVLRPQMELRFASIGNARVKRVLAAMLSAIPPSAPAMLIDTMWTFLNWAFKLAGLALVLKAFVSVTPATAGIAVVGGELASVISAPVPAGLGTYEAGIVAPLVLAGIPAVDAIKAAVNVHLLLLTTAMILGFAALATRPPAGPPRS